MAMVIFSVKIKLIIVYGANLRNAGTNPAHNFETPSDLMICVKQSNDDLYGRSPVLVAFWFCNLLLTTSKGLEKMLAIKDEHNVATNNKGNPPKIKFPSWPKMPVLVNFNLISEENANTQADKTIALSTVTCTPVHNFGNPSSDAILLTQSTTLL